MKILLGYDGSKSADRALDYVKKIAKPSDKIFVLYVIDEDLVKWRARLDISVIWDAHLEELEKNIKKAYEESAKKILDKAKRKLRKFKNKKFLMEVGYVPEVIVSKAKELGCDLIVLGKGERRLDIQEMLIGSVADKVVQSSPIPVMVVK